MLIPTSQNLFVQFSSSSCARLSFNFSRPFKRLNLVFRMRRHTQKITETAGSWIRGCRGWYPAVWLSYRLAGHARVLPFFPPSWNSYAVTSCRRPYNTLVLQLQVFICGQACSQATASLLLSFLFFNVESQTTAGLQIDRV